MERSTKFELLWAAIPEEKKDGLRQYYLDLLYENPLKFWDDPKKAEQTKQKMKESWKKRKTYIKIEWSTSKAIQYCDIEGAAKLFDVTVVTIHNKLAKGGGVAQIKGTDDEWACIRKVPYEDTQNYKDDFLKD